ncbi:hypothetical protein [Myxococcus sp. RHSTA-1-4]|uniref:hypothetical protein n=1 Tax=Myxococcus sp. RHSTA-1-4 TaxID=2874601 RepID=UPI001CBDC938|nr:hypothetical protein [Myxococcus sp. RHSTA-1-4]MBZ4416006.1 hypothetical protein [Myxococcus sp. RHSTA-1-4]
MARRPRTISFPHPVVGVGDDVDGALSCNEPELDFGVDTTALIVDGLQVENPTIAGLIRQGEAAFTVRVTCGATYYRETFQTQEGQLRHVLPTSKLLGDVKIQVRVCTLKRLESYRPEGLHPDYEGRSFAVQAGDVLAVGDDFTVRAEKQFDPLATDIPSIMRITRGKEKQGAFHVDFTREQIVISLSHEDYARYGVASNVAPGVIHSAVVFPVLCEAIAILCRPPEENEFLVETRWFPRLKEMLEARGIDASESLVIAAQKLLDAPLARALADTLKGREDD